jgi:hypothetical protein
MIPIWLLPIMTTLLCAIGGWLAWQTGRRAERRAADAQELREVDAWLEAMWKA